MAQLIIQNNGRQPFTFYVLRKEQAGDATIIEKITLLQGNQFHFRVDDIAGKSFSAGIGTGGEKGEPAGNASLSSKIDVDFSRHDRWTVIYNGEHWSSF
jgi:hypothetical protein